MRGVGAAPDHTGDAGAFVLEIEIDVAVGMVADLAQFAAHADIAISILDGAFERRRELGYRQFGQIEAWFVHEPNAVIEPPRC